MRDYINNQLKQKGLFCLEKQIINGEERYPVVTLTKDGIICDGLDRYAIYNKENKNIDIYRRLFSYDF